jgi:F-type H+-transporting ATPase subunit b
MTVIKNMDITLLAAATEVVSETSHATEASGGVLGTLGIDLKLFIAQLVNFGIVLFVIWKWVVGPLGKTLTERQEKIEQGLKHAEEIQVERGKFDEKKLNEMKKIRHEADDVLRTATDTANKMKQEIISDAHKQSEKMLKQTEASIAQEKEQMLKEVKSEVATLVVAASEKILQSKLDKPKDQELIKESLKTMQ